MPDYDTDELRAVIANILNEPHLIGDIICICEVTDQNGDVGFVTLHNENEMTVWKELGMLYLRIMEINNGHFVLDGDDG